MIDSVVAVADGPLGMYATLDTRGDVAVFEPPSRLLSRFTVPAAEGQQAPSHRLAMVMLEQDPAIVVGSWTGGVTAFNLDGSQLWSRPDIRQVQRLRSLPTARPDGPTITSVIQERVGGTLLGPSGGTRRRLPRARYVDGWPDGSLLMFDGARVARLTASGEDTSWQLDLQTLAILDTVVREETVLLCTAEGRLTCLDREGVVTWRTQPLPERRILRIRAHPERSGWLGLAVPTGRPVAPLVVQVSCDGQVSPLSEHPGSWVDFVDRGRRLIATNGTVGTLNVGA